MDKKDYYYNPKLYRGTTHIKTLYKARDIYGYKIVFVSVIALLTAFAIGLTAGVVYRDELIELSRAAFALSM